MKKRLCTLLCLLVMMFTSASALSGCSNEPSIDENARFPMTVFLTDAYTKLFPNRAPEDVSRTDFVLRLAKNDAESFQLVLLPEETVSGISVSLLSGDTQGLSLSYCSECYAAAEDGTLYPDALPPLAENEAFSVSAGSYTPIFVKVKTQTDASFGERSLRFGIFRDGALIEKVTLNLRIYDVLMPNTFSCETSVGFSRDALKKALGDVSDEELDAAYKTYYEFLLSYGLSPTELPVSLLSDEADAYLSDPRMSSFVIPYPKDSTELKAYADKLYQDYDWLQKGFFYYVDEPRTVDAVNTLVSGGLFLRSYFPDATVITPISRDIMVNDTEDTFEALIGTTNLWCPKAAIYSSYIYSEEIAAKFDPIPERMAARKEEGDRLWWYVCCEPGDPYCNVHMNMDGLCGRILFWQQSLENVDGFLYWTTNYWEHTDDPLSKAPYYLMGTTPVYGDGTLVYCGEDGAPLSSLRLELTRDGLRDFEYLTMAKKLLGEEAARNLITPVTTSVLDYTDSADTFNEARAALLAALETAGK